MKRIILFITFLCIVFSQFAFAETTADTDVQINSLYAANKLDEAYKLLISIPDEERTSQQCILIGNILMDKGSPDEAMFMYKSALDKDLKSYKAYYNIGNIHLTAGRPNMAIDNYKLAIKYNKEFAPAYYNMGCAYIKLNDLKKAKSAFHNAVFYKPNNADYHYNLAYTYKTLGKTKDAQYYLDFYNKIIQNNY